MMLSRVATTAVGIDDSGWCYPFTSASQKSIDQPAFETRGTTIVVRCTIVAEITFIFACLLPENFGSN